jgi:hypothetical protein
MSRSQPAAQSTHPSQRWFEWDGAKGQVRWYDRELKEQVVIKGPFVFLLLDQLASVGGWHKASESGMYATAVRNVGADPLTVKSFKGGIVAEGLYKDIKDKVKAAGGHFEAQVFIAFRPVAKEKTVPPVPQPLQMGVLRLKGAALAAWMQFQTEQKGAIYAGALAIDGCTEGQTGATLWKAPVFKLKDASKEALEQAMAIDVELQAWLASKGSAKEVAAAEGAQEKAPEPVPVAAGAAAHPDDELDDIPF